MSLKQNIPTPLKLFGNLRVQILMLALPIMAIVFAVWVLIEHTLMTQWFLNWPEALSVQELQAIEEWSWRLDLTLATGSALLLFVLFGVLVFSIDRFVSRRLRELLPGQNDLERSSPTDEISSVAERIYFLEKELTRNYDRVSFRHRSFLALLSISESTAESLSLNTIFQLVADKVHEITGFDYVGLRLYDPDRKAFRLMAQNHMSPEMSHDLQWISMERPQIVRVIAERKPIIHQLTHRPSLDKGFRYMVEVPLLGADQLVGTMDLITKGEYEQNEEELRWLAFVGRFIGLVIRHKQLSERLRDVAVLQERSHIAQEIHDGLAQLVGSIRVWAEEAETSLDEKDYTSTQIAIGKVEQSARDAYVIVREEMLGLRNTLVPGQSFCNVMKEYLSRFQREWNIKTDFQIQSGADGVGPLAISPSVEIQSLRIFQEALTNIRRHANATCVSVTCISNTEFVLIRIQDNGDGFNPADISADHLGLQIMRERATSIGGQIQFHSELGHGTRVELEIPRCDIRSMA
jgi:two-component system, NarL family, nitrate/nitrite sensor histidine kinase NarX